MCGIGSSQRTANVAPQDTRTPGKSPRTLGQQDTRKAATNTRTPGRLHDIKKAVRTPGHQEATHGHQDIREPSRTLGPGLNCKDPGLSCRGPGFRYHDYDYDDDEVGFNSSHNQWIVELFHPNKVQVSSPRGWTKRFHKRGAFSFHVY